MEVRLLGAFRITVGGEPVEESRWPRRKAKLLLKLLALQPQHQLHREQVMEFLWPEIDPEAASNNLHKVIHMARRALEPTLRSGTDSHFILVQAQQILLRAPGSLWVDSIAFDKQAVDALKGSDPKAYEVALALYQGDLLTEDLYDDWCATQRHHHHLGH